MKRLDNLFQKICTLENINEADNKARKNKGLRYGIIMHDVDRDEENRLLLQQLLDGTYKTSAYSTYTIYEPKERLIYRLPYYPDRIVHHAIMNVMEPIWKSIFIDQTYSSIKDRGIHACAKAVRKALDEYPKETIYCLKLDIHKFYPSIDHSILKQIIRIKIKDKRLLNLLDDIIDSAPGVPIGNYLSQFFANLYLAYFDHWVKETLRCKFYFRYADDIVILGEDKELLNLVLININYYLTTKLKLELKPNYQIFPVDSRGIDFVGYKFYHPHTLLRKSIKVKINRLLHLYNTGKLSEKKLKDSMQSYFGWLKYCDSKHYLQKIESITGIHYSNFRGEETIISNFYNKIVRIIDIQKHSKYFVVHCYYHNKPYTFKSSSKKLLNKIEQEFYIQENEKRKKTILPRLSLDNPETWQQFLLL